MTALAESADACFRAAREQVDRWHSISREHRVPVDRPERDAVTALTKVGVYNGLALALVRNSLSQGVDVGTDAPSGSAAHEKQSGPLGESAMNHEYGTFDATGTVVVNRPPRSQIVSVTVDGVGLPAFRCEQD